MYVTNLKKIFNIILNDYLSFNFNFIKNKSRDENYKFFEYGHKAALYMAKDERYRDKLEHIILELIKEQIVGMGYKLIIKMYGRGYY